MTSLLWSSNIPNRRPKIEWQLLVVVGSWAGNFWWRIQSEKNTWSKDLVMVSLICITMVCDLNGLSDSRFVVSVRLRWTETTRCCDSLGSIRLSVFPYPRGFVVNSVMSSESWFHTVLLVSNRNKPNWWESTASPNLLALKGDVSSVQVVGNVDWSDNNTWLWIIWGNDWLLITGAA